MNENDLIEYCWLNMDHGTSVTEEQLRKYAETWRRGFWRCNGLPLSGPVLMGFGTKPFTHEAMDVLYRRLSG